MAQDSMDVSDIDFDKDFEGESEAAPKMNGHASHAGGTAKKAANVMWGT